MTDDFVPYDKRPEWSDVVPIPQDDGPDPLAPIAYTKEYSISMNYFRAISRKNELSERALELTNDIIDANPAHYTIWHYRKLILFALGKDLHAELEWVGKLAEASPKNYQLWHHRQVILEKLKDPTGELEFINSILDGDSKNYHAWSHRQWVNKHFNLWDGELEYVDRLLNEDVRNNSAWNQRYYILFHRGQTSDPSVIDPGVIDREIKYTIEKIKSAPNNISPWNYLRGLYEKGNRKLEELEGLCKSFEEDGIVSPHALGVLVDIFEERAMNGSKLDKEEAIKTCSLLAESHDNIRQKYWEYRKAVIAAR